MKRKEILELEFSDALITIYKYLNERGRVLIEGDPNGIELTPQEMVEFGKELIEIGEDMKSSGRIRDTDNDTHKKDFDKYMSEREEWKVGDKIRITCNKNCHSNEIGGIVTIHEIDQSLYTPYNTSIEKYGFWISKEEGEKVYE